MQCSAHLKSEIWSCKTATTLTIAEPWTKKWNSWRYITWWRHKIETVSALLALCAANSPVTVEFPSQGQWRGALMFSLICAWTNGRVHNRYARRWFETPSCSSWRHCYDIQQHTWQYHNRLNDLLDKFLTKAAYGNDVGQVLNLLIPFDANVREWTMSLSIWVTAWFRIGTKRLFVPTSAYHQFRIVRKIWIKIKKLFFSKMHYIRFVL